MEILIALLYVAACCYAAETAFSPAGSKSQGALLVLPLQDETDNTNTTTTQNPVEDGTDTLEDINAKLMERLKQEQGSERGVYHVYLQDGRLQRVQYTTAPIRPLPQAEKQKDATSNYNQEQSPEILSPEFSAKRGVYFIQVPQERIQALQANSQQTSQRNTHNSEDRSIQYNQETERQPILRYLPIHLTEASRQQQGEPSGYLASVQYSEVEPIQGPVYSYKPEGLTRILRYAPSL